jgi:hypothetical protein
MLRSCAASQATAALQVIVLPSVDDMIPAVFVFVLSLEWSV